MAKLKTLKDFEGCDENGIEIDYSELKEEAIKWIKEFDKNILNSSDDATCPYPL